MTRGLFSSLAATLLSIFILAQGAVAQTNGAIEFRGQTQLINNSCGGTLPAMNPINMRLSWVLHAFFTVRDRNEGISMDGSPADNGPFLTRIFPMNNGCNVAIGYYFRNLNKRAKRAKLRQIFHFMCPTTSCGVTYEGLIRGR